MAVYANAARCRACGQLAYPTHFYCARCDHHEFDPERLQGEGKLLTWTRLTSLPRDMPMRALLLGIVEFDQGLRVTGQLAIDEPRSGECARHHRRGTRDPGRADRGPRLRQGDGRAGMTTSKSMTGSPGGAKRSR